MSDQVTFIQVPLNLRELSVVSGRRGWGSVRGVDEGRALHHALGEVFGPKSLQPFRLMITPHKMDAVIYAYSTLSYDELRQNIQISPPDIEGVFDCSGLRHKTLETWFSQEHRLGFDIRIRPIRRLRNEDRKIKSGREIDVYQHAVENHIDEPEWKNDNSRESVYLAWLAERFGSAAILESANLVRFQRTIAARDRSIEGPDAVIQGVVRVKDEEAFASLISKGVGRHKAYGYGMILLRPANRPPLKG